MGTLSGPFAPSRLSEERDEEAVPAHNAEQPVEAPAAAPSTAPALSAASTADALEAGSADTVAREEDAAAQLVGAPHAGECVICLNDLDEEITELSCHHKFHANCIREWLDANGKCPICRRVIDERVVARATARDSATTTMLDPRIAIVLASGAAMENTQILLAESRRLMMFATMQAALSVLIMSYVTDMVSPPLMLLSASFTFVGASQFSLKAAAFCRPLLCLNVLYHLYLLALLAHKNDGAEFFSNDYTNTRAVLLSLGCVVVMEAVALKKVGFFYFRLLACSELEVERMRRLRRAQAGWAQRVVVFAMFAFLTTPVLAKYLCLANASRMPSDMCTHTP